MNLWIIAFPCLVFLGSLGTCLFSFELTATLWTNTTNVGTGIMMLVFQGAKSNGAVRDCVISNPTLPYLSISISLNVLLTLMIVVRLVLHSRNIRTITGAPVGIGGMYRTIITMLIESSALYAVSSLVVIGQSSSGIAYLSMPILFEIQVRSLYDHGSRTLSNVRRIGQVIAPLLIIKRVANRNALTGSILVTGTVSSIEFGSGGEVIGDGVLPGGYSMSSVDSCGTNSGELGVGVGTPVDFRRDSKV